MFKLFTDNPLLRCSSQIKFGIYVPGWTSITSNIIGSPVSHNQVPHKTKTACAMFDLRAAVEVEIINENNQWQRGNNDRIAIIRPVLIFLIKTKAVKKQVIWSKVEI